MSIINQMLKDLDKAKKKPGESALPPTLPVFRVRRKITWTILLLCCLGVGLLFADMYVVIQHRNSTPQPVRSVVPPASISVKPAPVPHQLAAALPAPSQSATVSAVTLQVQEEETRVQIVLTQTVLYRLEFSAELNRLLLTLDQTMSATPLPQASVPGSALEGMVAGQTGTTLKIAFQMKKGATLRQSHMEAGKLQLVFSYPQSRQGEAGATEPVVLRQALPRISAEELRLKTTMQRVRVMARENHSRLALRLLQQHSPAIEKHPDYYALMAALYQRTGQPAIAARLYSQLLPANPHEALWWLGLAISLEETGRHSEAVMAFEHAREEAHGLSPQIRAWIDARQMLQ